jgi:hypothetical protein
MHNEKIGRKFSKHQCSFIFTAPIIPSFEKESGEKAETDQKTLS